jgi:ribonuclease HI
MGVYFGKDSWRNFNKPLTDGRQTSQRGEIWAAIIALRQVRKLVEHRELFAETVVLFSDSAYVVKAMSIWEEGWRRNWWVGVNGCSLTNSDDLQILDNLIEELEENCGVYVKLRQVDREENKGADRLARKSLESLRDLV